MKQVSPKIYTSDFSLLTIYNIHYKGMCSNDGSGSVVGHEPWHRSEQSYSQTIKSGMN